MNRQIKLQILAGVGSVATLPLLYVGLKQDILVLTVLGLAVFTLSMLVMPVLRLLPDTST